MPELPEMENYRILLSEKVLNIPVTNIEVNREKSTNVSPKELQTLLLKHKIERIERRAKHLLFHIDNGMVLLLHLMLGGLMFYGKEEDKPDRTIQIRLSFGVEHLYFIGLRLGYLDIYEMEKVNDKLSDLGPEPLDENFGQQQFSELFKDRRGALKTKLIDQQFLSGIGNCYSDEICFHAGILPTRDISELTEHEIKQLYLSIQFILKNAVKHGGYMEQPLFKEDQLTGGYSKLLSVYDRKGEVCKRCGATIMLDEISSRKTFYCSNCQK